MPLLFVTFRNTYGYSLDIITLFVTLNFGCQLLTDIVASRYAQRIGTRTCMVAANLLSALGLIGMGVLPSVLNSTIAFVISIVAYGIGSGLLEVLVSPIVEACPTRNKEGLMSLLHSFYCWGVVVTILGSTAFFAVFGIHNWRILACLWSILPLVNSCCFTKVRIYPINGDAEDKPNYGSLFSKKIFWLLVLMMICSGGSELSVAQWASAFTEEGLKVSKTMGDLVGACGFALMMGLSRSIYAKYSEKIKMQRAMLYCAVLCLAGYMLAAFSPHPMLGLFGCCVVGFSVGLFWPGTISIAARKMNGAGTTMFALMALGGDIGCSVGPTVVGMVSKFANENLCVGIASAAVFPFILLFSLGRIIAINERKNG